MVTRIIGYALAAIIAALATATLSARMFSYDSVESVMIFGAAMGVINSFIRPLVRMISAPLTCLTFGLFAFVVNAAMFYLGAYLIPGIDATWWGCLVGSVIASVAAGLMFSVLDE